jgi:predicted nucleic acid-binding protein
MGIRRDIKGKRVYFDTNVFIYLVEGYAAFQTSLNEIRESILHQEAEIFTSELTLCEVLVLPFRSNNTEVVNIYRQLIEESGAFTLLPTKRETYIRASLIRAQMGLKMADAIHMATAVEYGCEVFVSNDTGLKVPKGMALVGL